MRDTGPALGTLDAALAAVSRGFSPSQLDALADAIAAGRGFVAPGGSGPAGQALVATLAEAAARAERTDRSGPSHAGVALALRNAAELRRDEARSSVSAVWTGPEAEGTQRLTASVVQQMLAHASDRVLVVSFAVSIVTGIKEALAAAAARGVAIDFVFETEEDSGGRLSGSAASNLADIPRVRFWRWRAEQRDHERASLHAKVIVVDSRDALVTSANLTERAFNDNLELGILLRNHAAAASIDTHVRSLIDAGVLTAA